MDGGLQGFQRGQEGSWRQAVTQVHTQVFALLGGAEAHAHLREGAGLSLGPVSLEMVTSRADYGPCC